MQLPALITSDLHLVASESAKYRWALFPWLNEQIQKHHVRTLLILGDITDAKDNHSAELANLVVQSFDRLRLDDIIVLAGNHDWLKRGQEFFRFLNYFNKVRFITKPYEDEGNVKPGSPSAFFLPYSKNPMQDWKGFDFSHYDYLFLHQTLAGAIASNGEAMEGEALPPLNAGRVFSGDIHVPQDIGGLTYVGSPYHVHFGDNFTPRCILIGRDGKEQDLHFPSIRRMSVRVQSLRELSRLDLRPGDQIKLRMNLAEEDKHAWSRIKREAMEILRDAEVSVHGIELSVVAGSRRTRIDGGRPAATRKTPAEAILSYVQHEELPATVYQVGLDILEGE